MSEKPSTVRDLPASSFIVCHTPTLQCHGVPHSDLACPTECCELIANEEQVVHDNIHLEFACRGEITLLFSEVARRFHLTLSTNLNKTVVYGPAKWIYLIHIKVHLSI